MPYDGLNIRMNTILSIIDEQLFVPQINVMMHLVRCNMIDTLST